jgi:hypothetical protein
MPSGKTLLIILFSIGLLWTLWSWYVTRGLEKPSYTVVSEGAGYEIRQYDAYIVAETTVTNEDHWGSLNEGFVPVADYIFGNNTSSTKISMTVPVIRDTAPDGEKIDMTTPVLREVGQGASTTVAFVMPSQYTLETLPTPNNEAVRLREVPARTVAVRTFSWYATAERIETQTGKLRASLTADGYSFRDGELFAAYNPPLTVPFLRQYEVMVELTN